MVHDILLTSCTQAIAVRARAYFLNDKFSRTTPTVAVRHVRYFIKSQVQRVTDDSKFIVEWHQNVLL